MESCLLDLRERLLRAGIAPRHVRRYVSELRDHLRDLESESLATGLSLTDARAAARARLGTPQQLADAMIDQPGLRSWTARAPWAVFVLGPTLVLAAAYLLACLMLWSGWMAFIPSAETPFGIHVRGFANLWFQAGRALYYGAPVPAGWAAALIAARQRLRAVWPAFGATLVALLGACARVQAGRASVSGRPGHIRVDLIVTPTLAGLADTLSHALLLLLAAALPYVVWRLGTRRVRASASSSSAS